MQSTELEELLEALNELASQADDYDDDKGVYPILVSDDAPVLRHAASAIAAERDRADRAEARFEEVWDEGAAFGWHSSGVKYGDNPYRTEATA